MRPNLRVARDGTTKMKDLKERAVRGGFARICAQGGTFVVRIGSLAVLARLLEPRDFGLVGMVTAVIGVLGIFRDFGLSTASVQRSTVTEEQMSTLFWINLLVGTVLAVLGVAAAPVVVTFYHEPRLFGVMVVLATGFVFNAAGVQHSSLLQRQMRFTTLAMIDMVALVVSTVVAIGMAFRGLGYWSLCALTVIPPVISTISVWLFARWIPGMPHRQIGIRSIVRFGGTVTLNSLVIYVAYNLEKVLLGRYWGAESIGIYGRAYTLISTPTDSINSAVGGVAFSALARVQDDPPRFRTYFLKGYSLVLALTVPATFFCALFGNDIILVVLGAKWKDAAPILRLLAPTILAFAMINPLGWLLIALGLVGRSLKIALVIAPLVIAGYLLGLHYGPKGVALGYSAAMMLWLVPHILWCIRGTPITFRDILTVVARPLASSIVGAALAFGAQLLVGHLLPPLFRFMLEIVVLYGAYLVTLLYVMGEKAFYRDLIRTLRASPASKERTLVPA